MHYSISYWCVSHIGKRRKSNQDNFICNGNFMEYENNRMEFPLHGRISNKLHPVFGIFDGMGGEECGEMASYLAAKRASSLKFRKDDAHDLLEYCKNANNDICEYTKDHQLSSMGTTAAILAFSKQGITLCNIGDSKIFRFHQGMLEQLSQDHVAVAAYGKKPPLLQNLGIPPTELVIEPYLARGMYHDGDMYLICSDGLTDMVSNEEIKKILVTVPTDKVIDQLLAKALDYGGRDNISIILCRVERKNSLFFKNKSRE